MKTIVRCDIHKSIVDPSLMGVFVWYSDDKDDWELLFTYYANELSFTEDELIGLTDNDARELHRVRDLEYFRS